MSESNFDLVKVIQIIAAKFKFILIFALGATAIGYLASLLQTKEYTSYASFIVKSPTTLDRNVIFRQGDYQPKDFFASESEVDHVVTICKSAGLLNQLVDSFDLKSHYGVKDNIAAAKRLKSNYKVVRSDTRNIQIYIEDADPEFAASMVRAAVAQIELTYEHFFYQTNREMVAALNDEISEINESLAQVNDSIAAIRASFDVYNRMLPARGKSLSAGTSGSVSARQAAGLEKLQAVTSIKDQLIQDRANFVSLINEYRFDGHGDHVTQFYMVETAYPSIKTSSPKTLLILLGSFVAGLLFGSFIVIFRAALNHKSSAD